MTDRIIKAIRLHLLGTLSTTSAAASACADQIAALAEEGECQHKDNTVLSNGVVCNACRVWRPMEMFAPEANPDDHTALAERIVDALLTIGDVRGSGDRLEAITAGGTRLGGRDRGPAIATVLRVLEGES